MKKLWIAVLGICLSFAFLMPSSARWGPDTNIENYSQHKLYIKNTQHRDLYCASDFIHYQQISALGRLLNIETAEEAFAESIADIEDDYETLPEEIKYLRQKYTAFDITALIVIVAAIVLPIVIVKRRRKKAANGVKNEGGSPARSAPDTPAQDPSPDPSMAD